MKTTKNNYNVAYYMLKDFDQWNKKKKQIDNSDYRVNILFEKTKTPFGVFSEASDVEASVCSQSIANEISLSNELNYLLSRGEIS